MYRRLLIHSLCLAILLSTACTGEAGGEEQKDAGDPANVAVASRRVELTAAELADDSVFHDGSRPVSWENAGISDPVRLKKFIRKLQIWVDENQVDSIGTYLNYPLQNPPVKDAKDFKLNYSTYFSDGVKAALADQKLNQVFRNEQGAMIGQGQIWFIEKNNRILILAINN